MLSFKQADFGDAETIHQIGRLDHVTNYVSQRTLEEIGASILDPNEVTSSDLMKGTSEWASPTSSGCGRKIRPWNFGNSPSRHLVKVMVVFC
ncbi:hypothetical protein GCM10007385_44920 [Tateyamaria omphalii]|nr:hypothetical protein GCM10007385_44920 [Tateyamaria omphalii]